MATLVSLCLYKVPEGQDTVELFAADDLSHIGFVLRSTVRKAMKNEGHIIARRVGVNQRKALTYEEPGLRDYLAYAWVHPDGLAAVVFAGREYPQRVAFGLMSEATRIFLDRASKGLDAAAQDQALNDELTRLFRRYQNPEEADKLTKVQKELDEVKEVVTQSMEALLQRGSQIEDLMSKSDKLSKSSMDFKRVAERNNSWCFWLQKVLFGKSP